MHSHLDWLPYFGPMLGFTAVVALAGEAPERYAPALLAARLAVPLALFLYFAARGAYPELGGFRPGGAALLDVAVGLGVTVLWTAPYLIWPQLRPGAAEAFDPNAAGDGSRLLLLALRFGGFALVTPFIEELLVRSFLMRAAEVYDKENADFRNVPIGRFGWRSFLFTVGWFTFTHAQWEWPVAFLTGVLYNLWLYRRKHIGALILTHAVTNASLFWLVLAGSGKIPDLSGARVDLWFFL